MYLLQPAVFKAADNDQGVGFLADNVSHLNEPGIICEFTGCFSENTGSTLYRDPRRVNCTAGKTRPMILKISVPTEQVRQTRQLLDQCFWHILLQFFLYIEHTPNSFKLYIASYKQPKLDCANH